MVAGLSAGGPALVAGLEVGDVVYEVDGRPVKSMHDFAEKVAASGVGNPVELSVARDGALLVLEAITSPEQRP